MCYACFGAFGDSSGRTTEFKHRIVDCYDVYDFLPHRPATGEKKRYMFLAAVAKLGRMCISGHFVAVTTMAAELDVEAECR